MNETFELASSLRNVVSLLSKRLRKQVYSVDSFSLTETYTLSYLYYNGVLYPSELAAITMVKAQSMTQVLNRLEQAKLIARIPDGDDKRKVAISLTTAGKKVVEQTRYERDEWLAGAVGTTLTDKERKTLAAAVVILQKLADMP